MKEILLVGGWTSLGAYFRAMAVDAGHRVWLMPKVATEALAHETDGGTQIALETVRFLTQVARFDWVLNCEGRNYLDRVGHTRLGNWPLMTMNVMPLYWVIDALVAAEHPGCRVLSIASQTYRVAQTNTALYCASKAALVHLSRTLARELAPSGWVINCLAPGKIEDTKMARETDAQVLKLRGWTEEEAERYSIRNIPMRRYTDRQEVCEAMFKILDLPAYINGTCIDMTGGA